MDSGAPDLGGPTDGGGGGRDACMPVTYQKRQSNLYFNLVVIRPNSMNN